MYPRSSLPSPDYCHRRRRSAPVVLIVTTPPDACLVASLGRAIEPVVHAKEGVHAARVGGIGVPDDAVLERECAHAWPVAMIRRHVGTARGREFAFRGITAALLTVAPPKDIAGRRLDPVIVFGAFALLFFGDPNTEIEIEVAAERRGPRESPAHPLLVRPQLRKRCA